MVRQANKAQIKCAETSQTVANNFEDNMCTQVRQPESESEGASTGMPPAHVYICIHISLTDRVLRTYDLKLIFSHPRTVLILYISVPQNCHAVAGNPWAGDAVRRKRTRPDCYLRNYAPGSTRIHINYYGMNRIVRGTQPRRVLWRAWPIARDTFNRALPHAFFRGSLTRR